ncbi:MAG: DUF1450 domain-containing protein [Clostridia bacterium]
MRPIVEFCNSNVSSYAKQVVHILEQNPDIDVMEYGCLGHCGECYMEPFALVDGEFVSAPTADELLAKINEMLRRAEEAPEKDFPF